MFKVEEDINVNSYEDVIKLIKSIGYRQRVDNYYVIREEDGYINISWNEFGETPNCLISFHKNYYNPFGKKDIDERFHDFNSFVDYITKYHSRLFLRHKLKKICSRLEK